MTEDKKLLLKDLSARFPYNVAIRCKDEESRFICYLTSDIIREIQNNTCYWDYKPYLFPMSSMTKEQKIRICALQDMGVSYYHLIIDHYNEWHLDYRGLIEKGLAIDATNKNIY
jgi:hypothetical protein